MDGEIKQLERCIAGERIVDESLIRFSPKKKKKKGTE
jgi:hypothetical protein